MNDTFFSPAPQPVEVATERNIITLGLPKNTSVSERRFPLTPEAVQALTERGFRCKMESGAGDSIHYSDTRYNRCGASIASREETLQCDIVIYLGALSLKDARSMRKGALLLTFAEESAEAAPGYRELLRKGVTTLAIERIEDAEGHTPFADVLHEIDGRAALSIASALLADAEHGKGILMGGVPGIVPCEALIIGSGDTALAAAQTAKGLGAIVRLMDNDVYSLRRAMSRMGGEIIASALHPRGLEQALRTADVVVYTDIRRQLVVNSDEVDTMKRGVITFDLSRDAGKAFPSMVCIDLATARAGDNNVETGARVCYVNAGSAVPRTAAMALSNTFLTFFSDIADSHSSMAAMKLYPGMQHAALTFMGKVVNERIGKLLGMRSSDIALYLSLM